MWSSAVMWKEVAQKEEEEQAKCWKKEGRQELETREEQEAPETSGSSRNHASIVNAARSLEGK